jgi:Na+/proline symporter
VRREVGVAGFDPTVPHGQPAPGDLPVNALAEGEEPVLATGGFGWEYIIWMGFLGLVSCGIWPTAVARALAMNSPQAVKRQYMLASVSFLIRFLIPCLWGICAFVFVLQHDALRELFFPAGFPPPDPLPDAVRPFDNLYAMPIFLGRILPAGLIGIMTAGMVAAFMSTHDSYLLCWSSVLTQDVVAPIYEKRRGPLSSRARLALTRVFILAIGVYVLCWGLIYHGSDDIWDYMAVTGAIYYNGAFALLLGGLYWKRASSTGAFLALFAGILAVLGLSPVQHGIGWILNELAGSSPQRMEWLAYLPAVEMRRIVAEGETVMRLVFQVAPARVGLISIAGTTLTMIVGSLLFPDRPATQPSSSI